jgi:hypothetical protein
VYWFDLPLLTCLIMDNIIFAFCFCFSSSFLTYTFCASPNNSSIDLFFQLSSFCNFLAVSGQLFVTKWNFNIPCPRGSSKSSLAYFLIWSLRQLMNSVGPSSFPCWTLKALERFCDLGTDSQIPLIIKSLQSLIFSWCSGVLLSHWGSLLGNLTSAPETFCPGVCSCSQITIATLQIMALSSPENRIPKIEINSAQVYICDPQNWLTCSETLKGSLRRGHNSFLKFWTSELVRGEFMDPISPPPSETSLRGKRKYGLSHWDWGKGRFSMSWQHCCNSFWSCGK